MIKHSWALVLATTLTGCASLTSEPTSEPGDGLVYYLPKKDLIITVKRTQAASPEVKIEASAAYPDTGTPYLLAFSRNLIGKNELHIGVTSTGLLTSATSTTTSGISDVLKNLAASLGAVSALAAPPLAPAAPCPFGTTTHVYDLSQTAIAEPDLPCGFSVTLVHTDSAKGSGKHVGKTPSGGSGIFYRQQEAFLVTVKSTDGGGINDSKIVLSPSKAGIRYLPIERTLFANNKADFGFEDGVPTKYDQNADGELIGLLKLPADVIGAYFGAVGQLFSSLKETNNAQVDAMNADLKLQLAKQKFEACGMAIRQQNSELIKTLECAK
jgi:hypothetical protein